MEMTNKMKYSMDLYSKFKKYFHSKYFTFITPNEKICYYVSINRTQYKLTGKQKLAKACIIYIIMG